MTSLKRNLSLLIAIVSTTIFSSSLMSHLAFAQTTPKYSRTVVLKTGESRTVRGVLVSCGTQPTTNSTSGKCNQYGCSTCGTCTIYGCPKCTSPFFGGTCNHYGCWDGANGSCNINGCSNNGTCNQYGCSDNGVCTVFGCP